MPRPPHAHPQDGILNRPPDHGLFLALTLQTPDPASTRMAVEDLRNLLHRELRSQLDDTNPGSPKDQPSAETGELGFTSGFDRYHLTVTVGFAKSAYDKLGVLADQQPQDLRPIDWASLGDQNVRVPANGDLFVQVCTDSVYIAEHVQRRIEEELGSVLAVTWVVAGAQRHNSRSGRVNRDEGRALIGFKDGTSNLDPRHDRADATLVFVDPDPAVIAAYPPRVPAIGPVNPYGGPQPPAFPPDLPDPPTREPEWCRGGSYAVVRASAIDTTSWDDRALDDQEHVVGRWKVSGSALDKPDDPSVPPAEPDLAADPAGAVTPVTAHIRKANPRGPEDATRRLFRRGYPLILADVEGTMRGLVFVAFARTITTQFEFITRAWTANPDFPFPGAGIDALRALEAVLCGGYFFVPPLQRADQPWSWVLPAAS